MPSDSAASWRSSTSAQAQEDLDGLLSAGLELAEQQLSERGEFFPFAIVLDFDDEGLLVMADPAVVGESPTSVDILAQVRSQLEASRATSRAVGVFYDATSDGADVIQAELEHRERVALAVLAPYRRDGRTVSLGAITAGWGQARLWT